MDELKFTRISRTVERVLSGTKINSLGRATGFLRRERQVTPHRLLLTILEAMGTRKVETFADLQRGFNGLLGCSVRYKPFYNQLAKWTFPRFMKSVFEYLLNELVQKVLAPLPGNSLEMFDDLIIQDGSSFRVADSLADCYPSRFTDTHPAAIEVHATMSVLRDQLVKASIAPDTQGERDFLPKPESLRGRLLLADRGYSSIDYCHEVAKAGGSFLIRFTASVNPTVHDVVIDGQPRPRLGDRRLRELLRKNHGKCVDAIGRWQRGTEDVTFRVVAIWNPQKKTHTVLATNLERRPFGHRQLGSLYRLRWQVELLFKEWKSYANLHGFQTRKPHIAEGMIWASLLAALLKRFLAYSAQSAFADFEASTRRTAMALAHRLPALISALLARDGIPQAMRELLLFLRQHGARAHPQRDRARGRLRDGLRPIRQAPAAA